ncbi:hypothetical protein KIN20_038139 [Parelaphostrongylus tenuis]|uniref:Receptor expression-enhancing protein n=1 Tax=Parelaphostrongylus tenuis TaxID=148309 RepID=A0AAD5WLJ7_PARTN|nr:hypothetical protein KIN20_038139 [Parelaphostrongylus tenuis]
MYNKKKYASLEKVLAAAEEKTSIKREKLVYGAIVSLIVYAIAVRSPGKEDDTQWLTYWIVFASFSIIDFSVFASIPFYWLFKIAFLMYLYLPIFNGATAIYHSFVDPACTFVESYFSANEARKDK